MPPAMTVKHGCGSGAERRRQADGSRLRSFASRWAHERQLSGGDRSLRRDRVATDLRSVECIASPLRLLEHRGEIDRHQGLGGLMFSKAMQLRMSGIAARLAGQDGLGQESFAPEGNEAGTVEILRMKGPQSHGDQGIAAASTSLCGLSHSNR